VLPNCPLVDALVTNLSTNCCYFETGRPGSIRTGLPPPEAGYTLCQRWHSPVFKASSLSIVATLSIDDSSSFHETFHDAIANPHGMPTTLIRRHASCGPDMTGLVSRS
jgi:hypothetical protein